MQNSLFKKGDDFNDDIDEVITEEMENLLKDLGINDLLNEIDILK